jgi:signal transduction histidine kinase
MKFFGKMPIQHKVTAIVMMTTLLALLVSAGAFIYLEVRSSRATAISELTGIADIIGDNSTAALEFKDAKVGAQIIHAVNFDPRIVAACVYTLEGLKFSVYQRLASDSREIPNVLRDDGYYFEDGSILMFRPIMLENRRVGTIYIQWSLAELYLRITREIEIAAGVLILVLFGAYLFSRSVQRIVTTPILRLAKAASAVSTAGDYSLRVDKTSEDELGTLVDQFNNMLDQVRQRDQEVKTAKLLAENHAQDLARSNMELQQFAYIASHDLQEPLRTISNMVTLLEGRLGNQLDEDSKEYMRFIVNGAGRMHNLIKDLLEYSRVGTEQRRFEVIDSNEILELALMNLRAEIENSSASVTSAKLPVISANSSQLLRMFQNLIANAIKYRAKDSPRVHVSSTEKGDHWIFSVEDNGIGIKPEYHGRIFEIFRRLHRQEEYSGTGVGLSICKKIAERHGGSVWVKSDGTTGSTFFFSVSKLLSPAKVAQNS